MLTSKHFRHTFHTVRREVSTWMRLVAGLVLMAFVSASALCFAHCNTGFTWGKKHASCHGHAKGSSRDPGQNGSRSSMACILFKAVALGSGAANISSPDLHLIAFIHSALPVLPVDPPLENPSGTRHGKAPEFIFTPEVYLGPALRSLAPPSLA